MGLHIISKSAQIEYGFPKQVRLLRSVEFRKVYEQGRRRSLDFLLAFALRTGNSVSRIGLTVPRAVGNSVERNRVKRRLREVVRRCLPELGPGWDIVFNARQSATRADYQAFEHTVGKFLESLRAGQPGTDAGPGSKS